MNKDYPKELKENGAELKRLHDEYVEKKVAEFQSVIWTQTAEQKTKWLTTTLSSAIEEGARRREQTLREEIEKLQMDIVDGRDCVSTDDILALVKKHLHVTKDV